MIKSIKPDSPCKDCKNRNPGCHSICDKYISFRAKLDDYNYHNRIYRQSLYAEKWKRGSMIGRHKNG